MSRPRPIPPADYQIPAAWQRVPDLRRRIEQAIPVYMLDLVLTRFLRYGSPNPRQRAAFGTALDKLWQATAAPFAGQPRTMAAKGGEVALTVAKLALNRQVSCATLPALLAAFYWIAPLIGRAPQLSLSANPALCDALAIISQEIDLVARASAGTDLAAVYETSSDLGALMAPEIERRMHAMGLYTDVATLAGEAA